MINITNKTDCCGCNACGDICPKDAITFKTDIEGFWYPKVDMNKCIDCGLCEKTCPIINVENLKKENFERPICYAAMHKNLEVRFDSTSGGLFSALAEKIYRENGYVGGAVYDDDFSVKQFISADKGDLIRLRSSKYQQSHFEGFYAEVERVVKTGTKVLVCGSPCQMAALRRYLRKDYDNLIIADFVCRGTNSPMIAGKFDDYLAEKHHSKLVYKKAKSKELGWNNLTLKTIYENGDVEYTPKSVNLFTRGYLVTNAFCRPSCYECKFKGFPRIADISLADFWGIEKVAPEMFDNIGTSLVLINNEKGKQFFDAITHKLKIKELSYEIALEGNKCLVSSLPPSKIDRSQFFTDAQSMNFQELAEKYFQENESMKRKLYRQMAPVIDFLLFLRYNRMRLKPIFQYIRYNYFCKKVKTSPKNRGYLWPSRAACIEIQKGATLILNARLKIGTPKLKKSKMETRFLLERGAKCVVNGIVGFGYGSDIEVFTEKTLTFHGGAKDCTSSANCNLTLICGDNIEIGYHVMIGRGVTIRDNNGGHYLNMQGYKVSKPVKIGNHVWLCEGCTIMQGVKIGDGAVIGAHAVVTSNVPANTLVAGNPARVVQTDIRWKY